MLEVLRLHHYSYGQGWNRRGDRARLNGLQQRQGSYLPHKKGVDQVYHVRSQKVNWLTQTEP